MKLLSSEQKNHKELFEALGVDPGAFFKAPDLLSDREIFRSCGWLNLVEITCIDEIKAIIRGRPCYMCLKKPIRFGDNTFEDRPIDKLYLSHYKSGAYIISEDFQPLEILHSQKNMLASLSGYLRSYFP